jgi:hypothetical protein
MNDLANLKRSLSADAIEGHAWLVITSNPAKFVGSGRSPVTCQDPTRCTAYNMDGEPVNRAIEGQFLYAEVIIAEDATLENGAALLSPDAVVVARTQLEVTAGKGPPPPYAQPALLVEKLYGAPGFINQHELAAAINEFATRYLKIDPRRNVHIQFTGQNMGRFPYALPLKRSVYRDTFN